jgi:hypothetical protein
LTCSDDVVSSREFREVLAQRFALYTGKAAQPREKKRSVTPV